VSYTGTDIIAVPARFKVAYTRIFRHCSECKQTSALGRVLWNTATGSR